MNLITVYRRPWGIDFNSRENWFAERTSGISYLTKLTGEEAAEEAFHLTNAPEECLTEDHKSILKKQDFKGPSLSTGDVVKVESVVTKKLPDYFLCKSVGWEKFEGNRIELLRFLS